MIESEDELVESQGWMVTYLDTFTLLLGFFVILTGLGDYKFFTVYNESNGAGTWVNTDLMAIHSELQQTYQTEIENGTVDVRLEDFEIRLSFQGSTFFQSGSATLMEPSKDIIDRSLNAFKDIGPDRFFVDVEGHTDSSGYRPGAVYSNWELSADRANAARRELLAGGLSEEKIAEVTGYADRHLFVKDDPRSPLNRRITITAFTPKEDLKISERTLTPQEIAAADKVAKAIAKPAAQEKEIKAKPDTQQ